MKLFHTFLWPWYNRQPHPAHLHTYVPDNRSRSHRHAASPSYTIARPSSDFSLRHSHFHNTVRYIVTLWNGHVHRHHGNTAGPMYNYQTYKPQSLYPGTPLRENSACVTWPRWQNDPLPELPEPAIPYPSTAVLYLHKLWL